MTEQAQPQKPANIYEAINAVMTEVGYVRKTRASGLNYTFAGEAALIANLRPEMVANGIFMHVAKISNVITREYATAKGTPMVNVALVMTLRFVHTSGTYIEVEAAGEGSDTGDKATAKAMTAAYKYALRETFCIETGDDPDKYPSDERASGQPVRGSGNGMNNNGGAAHPPVQPAAPTNGAAQPAATATGKPDDNQLADAQWPGWTNLETLYAQAEGMQIPITGKLTRGAPNVTKGQVRLYYVGLQAEVQRRLAVPA